MTEPSENTPLLAPNDVSDIHNNGECDHAKPPPANAYLKLSSKILTVFISFLSLSVIGLLIATYVLLSERPFYWPIQPKQLIRTLGIAVSGSNSCPSIFS
jgi:hypothetical protein